MSKHFMCMALLAGALIALPALAGEGHDHGDASAAPNGPALPRFAATSELFEMVGVVDGRRLVVYLDRHADNSPVQGAQVELEVAGAKVALQEHAPGEFEATLANEIKPGVSAVTATVVAGADADILAADLDVHEPAHATVVTAAGWQRYVVWAAGAALLAAALVWSMRRAGARRARLGGAA